MKATSLFLGLGLAGQALSSSSSSSSSTSSSSHRDYDNNDYYVLHLEEPYRLDDVASRLGMEHQGQLGELSHHHVFRAEKHHDDIVNTEMKARRRRKRSLPDIDHGHDALDRVLMARKQQARRRLFPRVVPPIPPRAVDPQSSAPPDAQFVQMQSEIMVQLGIADPTFPGQWHIFNTVQPGHDVNVTGLWLEGITGKNSTVAMVDDGVDMYSRDLAPNYFPEGSYDFNDGVPEPKPRLSDDRHGTRCAGEISAARNDVCGVGVAYDSKIAGIRILSKPISDADEAEAMVYKYQENQIYSCSWGPPDDGQTMEAPDILISRAMVKGVQEGRGGLGSIYVFASGNGAMSDDNCNFDGYTNSIFSITVGAVGRDGKKTLYAERCSAQLTVTYSSGGGDAIHTTDVGEAACTDAHGGTSAAAPLAAGIFALVLQVRPDLTWRDLQYLVIATAAKVGEEDDEWQQTAIGHQFSHTFGYGKIDSYSLVHLAETWKNVKPQAWYFSPWQHVNKAIPEGKNGLMTTFEVTADMLKEANVERLEHVTVTMNIEHTRRGDLSVDLISPSKVVSHIAVARRLDDHQGGYDNWTFMSVAHWGESGVGTWTIIVKDEKENGHVGTFVDWHLNLWGESIDASKAKALPLPSKNDDEDEDLARPTVSVGASTASIPAQPQPTQQSSATHTDAPTRPTKQPGGGSLPSKPADTEHEAGPGTSTGDSQEPPQTSSSWIEWLPSFGAPKTARVWIYGSVGLIGVFCCGLGAYFWIVRRRRLRNDPRNNYEFELIDEEEGENLNGAEKGAGGARKKKKRTRGGELYDAFAGGSDDDEFDEYRDRAAARMEGREEDEEEEEEEYEQFDVGKESDEDGDERGRLRRGEGSSR